MECKISYRELFKVLKMNSSVTMDEKNCVLTNYICEKFGKNQDDYFIAEVRGKLRQCFLNNFEKKFTEVRKQKKGYSYFEDKYSDWLQGTLTINVDVLQKPENYEAKAKRGRPFVSFEEASEKSKSRIVNTVKETINPKIIASVFQRNTKEEDKSKSKLLDVVMNQECSPVLKKIKIEETTKMTPEEALMMILRLNLSKSTYAELKKSAENHNHLLYPQYKEVTAIKRELLPKGINCCDTMCEVPLRSLVENIVNRLLELLGNVPKRCRLLFKFKYGFDGTSANMYNQKFNSTTVDSEESIFCSSLVPLQLINEHTDELLWVNPQPSATRFCSPIRIRYIKETPSVCKEEEEYIEKQIKCMQNTYIGSRRFRYDFYLTMIDGKTCSALNDSSSMTCHLCNSTISMMNMRSIRDKEIQPDCLKYGIPILHARIRFLEFVMHISYKLEVKVWRNTDKTKQLVMARKERIINQLRDDLNLLIDVPQKGYGNTNTGNVARKFFNEFAAVSRITGFDIVLLERFQTILAVLSSGEKINSSTFRDFCHETADRYVSLYPWYYMPISVHIILIHGYRIVDNFNIPFGWLSEEVQESRNKELKRYRENHSRKCSRNKTNQDTFERLILTSDIKFAMSNTKRRTKPSFLTPTMKSLLSLENNDKNYYLEDVTDESDLSDSDTE